MNKNLPPASGAAPAARILVPELGFSAGTETVLLQVLPRWVAAGREVVLAAPAYRLKHYESRGLDPRVRRVVLGWPSRGPGRVVGAVARRAGKSRLGSWLYAAGLRAQARRERASRVFLPWIATGEPVRFPSPASALVMDLAWRHYPAGWFGRSAAEADAALLRWLARLDLAFPVSLATEAELRAAWPKLPVPLVSVPHGSSCRRPEPTTPAGTPCFLTPASLTPNKNHLIILQAALRLWREGHDFRLVWTGRDLSCLASDHPASRAEGRELQSVIREHAALVRGRLETPGFVDDEALERLYSGALRIVLPSSYEGFGLPLIEAYERGARVVCSDIPPFREQMERYQMADLTTIVPVGSEISLAAALAAALTEHATSPSLPASELESRLARWTWDHAADAYLKALARA